MRAGLIGGRRRRAMFEQAPDAPDWDDYEAEQERMRRLRKRQAALYEHEENQREEISEQGGFDSGKHQFINRTAGGPHQP